jgi:hypothetical protein
LSSDANLGDNQRNLAANNQGSFRRLDRKRGVSSGSNGLQIGWTGGQAHSEVIAVSEPFNPYVEWLGIKPGDSPPDHYALLGIKRFEGDRQIVTSAAGAQLAKVRGIRPGSRVAEWQRVIDQLTAAKNCLCEPAAKAAYDKALRQRSAPGGAAPATSGSAIQGGGAKPDRTKGPSSSDSKIADQGRAGRNVLPPGKSDIAKQTGAPATGPDTPANSLNPLPPTKSRAGAATKAASSGSGIAASASSASPQTPAAPAMRLPLPSAIPTTAMPAAASASTSPQGASPLTPAGTPIHALPMPGMALPQQSAVPGLRPANAAPTPGATAGPTVTGTPAILLADSATPSSRQSANQSDQAATSPLERLGIGDEPEFRRKTGPQRRSSRMPLVATAIAIVAVVAVGLIIASKTRLGADLIASLKGSSSTPSTADSGSQPQAVTGSTSGTAITASGESTDPSRAGQASTATNEAQRPPVKVTPDATSRTTSSPKDPRPAQMPQPMPPSNPLLDQATTEFEQPKVDAAKNESPKPTSDSAKPTPESTRPPDALADPAQAAKFNQILVDCRSKLSQRRLAEARKLIETASQLAATADQHDAVDRIDALAKYVEGFWMAVRDAMKALKPTDEIDVTSTRKYIVVEASTDALTLRTEGATRKYTIDSLPSGLAIILALRWFEADKPENKVYVGAFHLVDPKTGPEYAKKDWEAAAAAGVDVKNLLPLLETKAAPDSPTAPSAESGPLPVPLADALDKAERKMRTEMEADFAAATKPSEKAELSKKLLEQAASGNDPARRYVMHRAARDLAADAGQPVVMIQAVDQMAVQFRIDALDMKADTLAAFPPKSITTGRTWGEAALKLADEAVAAGRQALAGRYAQIAIAAARTANSLDLLHKAQKRAKEIQDAAKAEAVM